MKISVITTAGTAKGEVEIADELLIKNGKGSQAVHDAVTAYRANQRQGTSKVKQIGDVHGSGKKPWRQKGTGRARAGSFASPIWRGGGVVFGPHPRDYTITVPKKVKALAFRKALSERLIAGDVVVVDELKVNSPKTKDFVGLISKIVAAKGATLVVTDVVDKNLKLAARNLPSVLVEPADSVNTYELLRFDKIVATRAGFEKLATRVSK
ncbi:MAG: 50S ribosomal protein L4 [Verrucomicrobiae bacterium]|nr:50S ribosomal protein L4 [Verrucomicrobiae bacterium]